MWHKIKTIIGFFYHRVVLISIAIVIQLAVLIAVIIRFNNYFVFFYWGSIFVSLFTVFWILNDKSNPSYKIAWIIPILLFPIFGGLFYIFFGGKKLSKCEKKKLKSIGLKIQNALVPNPHVLEKMMLYDTGAVAQSRYIQNIAFFPPYQNTTGEYFPLGEIKYERLKEELKKAEHFIFMEYFIIKEGVMWNSILDILAEKAKKGVDVRIIYDDLGCLLLLPRNYYQKLEQLGIKCCVFNPVRPVLSAKINNRDHRKITIIDGHTGFTGGINLADEYINEIERHGYWKDNAIMIKGEAVWNMTVMFLSMWDYLKGVDEDFTKFKNNNPYKTESTQGYFQPFADSPFDDETVGEIVYLNLLNKSNKYVYITTPYLIIDYGMTKALTAAAKSGVDVRIITPYLADKWYVHAVTRSNYRVLIENGVKIYEYTPGFIHSKTLVSDDEYAVIGSINMDYRSFYLHFECGVWMYKSSSALEVKEDFLNTLKVCKEITMKDIKEMKWYRRLIGTVLRIFAPLM
jgi:cardiolipin synthase